MTIRPIAADEASQFLDLLCDVFDLEVERARSVFYKEPLFDLDRKWALFEGDTIISILTTVPLKFGWGRAYGIAGVGTRPECRGKGYAAQLLERVFEYSQSIGETAAFLFATRPEVYERSGFAIVDRVIRGSLERTGEMDIPPMLSPQAIEERYARWAEADPNRLRRDDQRWRYWRWSLRVCTAFGDGYLCSEGSVIREVLVEQPVPSPWPTPDVEWLGLESVTEQLGVPLKDEHFELHLMARNAPPGMAMFMTDQF